MGKRENSMKVVPTLKTLQSRRRLQPWLFSISKNISDQNVWKWELAMNATRHSVINRNFKPISSMSATSSRSSAATVIRNWPEETSSSTTASLRRLNSNSMVNRMRSNPETYQGQMALLLITSNYSLTMNSSSKKHSLNSSSRSMLLRWSSYLSRMLSLRSSRSSKKTIHLF